MKNTLTYVLLGGTVTTLLAGTIAGGNKPFVYVEDKI